MKSSANKDFSHQDLRGKSFKGQDLTGADFSNADIRGVNFKGAILKGANFANAEGGVTKKSFAVYLLMILVLSALTGYFMTISNWVVVIVIASILDAFNNKTKLFIYTSLSYITYLLTSIIFIRKGKYNIWSISLIIILVIFIDGYVLKVLIIMIYGAIGITIVSVTTLAGAVAATTALAGIEILGIIILGIGIIVGIGNIAEIRSIAEALSLPGVRALVVSATIQLILSV